MPRPRPQLIFKSAASQWRRYGRTAATSPIKVFSPYITGRQVLRLVEGHKHSEIYTLFDAELFLSRASDLAQLRALVEAKVNVYLLPGLHAKIVWIPGVFLSVGSQNLTFRGLKNKEATATVSHEPWLSHIQSELQGWIVEREPITLEMIRDMEVAVAPFRPEFQNMKANLVAVDEAVRAAETTRKRLRQEAVERQRQEAQWDRRLLFKRSFKHLRTSTEMTAVVREFETGRVSLVAAPGHSFLRWAIEDNRVELRALNRYLCVVPELGRLGWARVSNGLITYFESGVRRNLTKFLGKKCVVEWNATQRLDLVDHNLTFKVSGHPELPDFTVTAWVAADGIEFTNEGDISKEVRRRKEEISSEIIRQLTQPFRYGQRLTGKMADKFLYALVGSEFEVRLARLAGHPILVAAAVSRP